MGRFRCVCLSCRLTAPVGKRLQTDVIAMPGCADKGCRLKRHNVSALRTMGVEITGDHGSESIEMMYKTRQRFRLRVTKHHYLVYRRRYANHLFAQY